MPAAATRATIVLFQLLMKKLLVPGSWVAVGCGASGAAAGPNGMSLSAEGGSDPGGRDR